MAETTTRKEVTRASERLAKAFERLEALLMRRGKDAPNEPASEQLHALEEEHLQLMEQHERLTKQLETAHTTIDRSIHRVEQLLQEAS